MTIIEINNLSKVYGKNDGEFKALNNINLKIQKGELLALTGKSGSGKSTLLNIIGQLDIASSGEVIVENINTSCIDKKQRASLRNKKFGFVVQHFALINDYTVYDNIELPLKYAHVNKKKRRYLINEISSKLGIEDKLKSIPLNLSGGQNQRVAIARAIVNNPDIILADEPTGALDTKTSSEVMKIFKELNKAGKTIIMVTHDLELAKLCNRVVVLNDGNIVSDTARY